MKKSKPKLKFAKADVLDSSLTPMQQLFVRHYLNNGFNATEASLSLGARTRQYASRSGYQMLRNPAVAAEINRIMNDALEEAGLTDKYLSEVLKTAMDACVNGRADKDGLVLPKEVYAGVDLVNRLKNASKGPQNLNPDGGCLVTELVNKFRSEY